MTFGTDGRTSRHGMTTSRKTSRFGKVTRRWNVARIFARCHKILYLFFIIPIAKDCFFLYSAATRICLFQINEETPHGPLCKKCPWEMECQQRIRNNIKVTMLAKYTEKTKKNPNKRCLFMTSTTPELWAILRGFGKNKGCTISTFQFKMRCFFYPRTWPLAKP